MIRSRLKYVVIVVLSLGAVACGLIGELEEIAEDFEDLAPGGAVDGELGGHVWQVAALTGAIIDTRIGGGSQLCDYYENVYTVVPSGSLTYVELGRATEAGDPTQFPETALVALPYDDIPLAPVDAEDLDPGGKQGVDAAYRGAHPESGSDGIFVFSFEFSNGHLDNAMLTGSQVVRTGGEFAVEAVGYWNDDAVYGSIASISPGGGFNLFVVRGTFDGPDRISGDWRFVEYTSWPGGVAPECASYASGSGTWTAESG